jgi:hypothetical protein
LAVVRSEDVQHLRIRLQVPERGLQLLHFLLRQFPVTSITRVIVSVAKNIGNFDF